MNYFKITTLSILYSVNIFVFTPCLSDVTKTNHTLNYLINNNIWNRQTPLKLHLGCGENHFNGYVNIDFPPSEHTVQTRVAADLLADLTTLSFPNQSVDEVRSHHVFEHFNRSTALALLCKWHQWLKIGGKLVIETPDFQTSIKMLENPRYTYQQKQVILRHLFGSHEAGWAVHWDGWYQEKYNHILQALGFENIQFELTNWKLTHNIIVRATKTKEVDLAKLKSAARNIFSESLVDDSEQKLLATWCNEFEKVLN